MASSKTLIKGTFVLTAAGIFTRILGFFFRISVCRLIGEEGMGLYQLIFPVYALFSALTCTGISTAISRCTARYNAQKLYGQSRNCLSCGLFLSLSLSFVSMILLQKYAPFIAYEIIREPRCASLLLILSYAFPFTSIHGCISGYFLGQKNTKIPALSQIIEQVVRISSVFFIFFLSAKSSCPFGPSTCVAGLAAGELFSAAFCIRSVNHQHKRKPSPQELQSFSKIAGGFVSPGKEIVLLSFPLTMSRVLTNALQSLEALSIPMKLELWGMSDSEALRTYGVLTGMALPCILFPSALTNSISTMLLPAVAEEKESGGKKRLGKIISNALYCCIFLGCVSCVFFLTFARFMGTHVLKSALAGDLILVLSFICPFLYANTSILGMINGLGKAGISSAINGLHLSVRIFAVFFLIESFGLYGYLWGLLASQILIFLLGIAYLFLYMKNLQDQPPSTNT